jgi:excisionase family DNA binding protein
MNQEQLAVDLREAARRLSLSPRTVATLISRRELPSRKVGRRRIIPVVALEAFVSSDQTFTQGGRPDEALQGNSGTTE